MLASPVLGIQTKAQFEVLHPQFLADLASLETRKLIKPRAKQLFEDWLNDFHDGLWESVDLGIARCSNRAERFHGIVNQRIKRERIKTAIVGRVGVYSTGSERQINEVLKYLRSLKRDARPVCDDPECVEYREMMSIRFGLEDFSCSHTIHSYRVQIPERPKLETENGQNIIRRVTGRPYLVQRADVIAATRPEECDDAVRTLTTPVSDEPDNEQEPDALPPSTHRVVLNWDDEKGPAEHVDQTATGIPYFNVAGTIVSGVFGMRARSKRLPAIDKFGATAVIFQHYVDEIRQQQFANDQDREKWLADYTVKWWYWASSDKDYPLAQGITVPLERLERDPEPIDDEDGQVLEIEVEV
jgi:hypothetical protein